MNEKNVGNLDVEAILANEELMKKLAAKVLDIIQQKPDAGVVCQGYYCNIAKGDQSEDWKCVCKKKLDSLDMELEDGLAASVAEDYPLNAEELDQVVTEIKTSDTYSGRLSRADMSRAVSKVLADNEIMRRKGGVESMKIDFNYTDFSCAVCGPNSHYAYSPSFSCKTWGPSILCKIGGPWQPCVPCSPNKKAKFTIPPPVCPVGYGLEPDPRKIDWERIGVEELINRVNRLEEVIATPSVEGLGNRINRLEAMVGLKKS